MFLSSGFHSWRKILVVEMCRLSQLLVCIKGTVRVISSCEPRWQRWQFPYLPRNYFFREIFVFFREISNFFFRENFALFSRNRLRRNFPISLETLVWSTKGMNIYFSLDLPKLLSLRTVVKRALSFMHGGSLVIILTIPLHSQFKYTDRDVPSLSFSLYFLSEWKFGNVFRIVYFKYLFFLR